MDCFSHRLVDRPGRFDRDRHARAGTNRPSATGPVRVMRRGYTLVELLVSLSVGALVLGLSAMIAFRHQRFHRDVVIAVERGDQLAELVALMPISLRGIAPGEGDIAPGAARDPS